MEIVNRQMYEAPAAEVVEVKIEGVICESQTSTDGVADYPGQGILYW